MDVKMKDKIKTVEANFENFMVSFSCLEIRWVLPTTKKGVVRLRPDEYSPLVLLLRQANHTLYD